MSDFDFAVYRDGDPTAIVKVDASVVSPGATRTLSVQDLDGTIALTSDITTVFTDSVFRVRNSSDSSKQIAFSAAGITTGQTRNVTVPNSDGTMAYTADLAGTGSGQIVHATSPTLVTPVLGVATATSINKVTITQPATGATLTLADGTTFSVDLTSLASGQGLVYNGTKWVNRKRYIYIPHRKVQTDSATTSPYNERIIFQTFEDLTVEDVFIFPEAALTSNDTNYALVTARLGVAGTTIGSFNTKTSGGGGSGSWVNNTQLSLKTLNGGSLSNTSAPSGTNVTLEITKPGGTGATVPIFNSVWIFSPA